MGAKVFYWACDSMDGCAQRRDCGWPATAAGDSAGGRAHSPTAMLCFFGVFDVISLLVVETQKSQRNVSGADRS